MNDLANNQPFGAVSQDAPIIRVFNTGQALIGNIEDSVLDYIEPYAKQTYTGTIDDLGKFKVLNVPINSSHLRGNNRTDKHIGTDNKAPYDPMIAAATYATLAQRRLLQDIRKGYGQNSKILDRLIETEYERQQISQQIRNIRGFQEALGNQFSTGIPDYLGEYAIDAMEFTNSRVEDPTLKRFQEPMKALHQAYHKLPDDSPLKIKTNDPKTFYTTLSQVLSELAIGTLMGDKRITQKKITERDWRNWIRSSAELLRFGVNTILKPIRNQILTDINKPGDKSTIVSIRPKTLHKLIKERTKKLPKEQRARVLWFMSISGLAQVPEDDAQRVLSLDAIIDSLETAIDLLEKEKKIKTTEGLARLVRDTFATVIGNAGHTPAYESAFRIYNAYYESRRRPELYGQQRATVTLQDIRTALEKSERDPSATRTISRNQGLLPFLSGQRNYIYITENGEQVSPLEYAEILKDLQKTKIVEEMTNLFEITEKIPISRTQSGVKINNQKWIDDIKKALTLEIERSLAATTTGVSVVQNRKGIEQAASQSTNRIISDLLRLKEFAKDGILTTVEYGQFRSILWNLERIAKNMPQNSPARKTIDQISKAFERMEWLRDAANSVVPTSLQNTSLYTLYYGFSDEAISSVTGLFNPVSRTIGMANFFRSLASHRGGVYNETIENALEQLDPNYRDVSLASRLMNPIGHQISAVGDFADVLTNLVTRPLQQVGHKLYTEVWGGMPASVDIYPWGALYDIEPYIAHWMEDAERMGLGRSSGAFMAMQILSMADPATIGITAASMLLGPTGIGRAIGAGAMGAVRGLAPAGRAVVAPIRTLSTNFGRLRPRWFNTSIAQAINGKYAHISPRLQHAQRVANVSMMHGVQAFRYGQGSALLIGDLADIVDAYYMGGGDPMTILTALVLNPEYVVSPRAGLARASILIQPATDRILRYSSALSAAGPFLRPEIQAHFSETKSLLESISVGPSSVFEKNSTILYYDRGDNAWKVGRVDRYDEATQKISAYNAENRLVEGIDLSQVMRVVPRSIANNRATIQSGLAGATIGIVDTIRNKQQRNITVTKSALLEALGDLGKQAIGVLEKTGIITHDTQTDAITLTRQGQNIAKTLENPSESLMTYIGATIAQKIHPNNTKQQQKFIQKFTKGMSFVKPEYRSLYLMEAIVQTAHKAYGGARTVFAGILPLKGIKLQYKNTTGYSPVTSELKDARTDSPRLQVEGKYSDETRTLPQDRKYITVENISLDIGENPDTVSILEEILSLTLGTDVTLAGIKTDPKSKNIITGLAFELSEEKSPVEISNALKQINNDIQTTSEMEQEFGVHTPEELAMIYTIANVLNPLTEFQQSTFAAERALGGITSYLEPETGMPLLQVAQQESFKRFVGTTPITQREVSKIEKEIQRKIKEVRKLENKVAALELELEQYRTQRKDFKKEIGGKRLEKEIRKTQNKIRDLQERVKNIRKEYNDLTKQYEEYRKDVKPLYASGGYSAAYLATPDAIPLIHTTIAAKVFADTSPDLTVMWGFDTLRFLKANVDAFLSSAANKEFYKNAYKLTYMRQLHKRMTKHLKQFSPEQIEQMIQESIDEWKTAPNIAFSKIIRRITDGQYDEELLTSDTIFQSALSNLNITLAGANNLEQLIGAYFTALSRDNLTLAAMYLTQLSVALNIANATAEEISRMANLSEDERLLMKEAAIQSVILSAMSIESYLPSSPVSAATIDQKGRAVTYKEALESIKQQAIEKYWQDIALPKIAKLAKQRKTILSEEEIQLIQKLYTSHANDILRFYEIASTQDFDEAYAWFVRESKLYKHMVGAFSQEMAPDKAKKFVREVMVAHHNMSNANYATLYTDKQTLKKASKYLADQPELIEALLLPLTQYAATQYTTQELNGVLVPKPQVIMLGNALWSTTALAEEAIHAMGDLIAAKVLQQYAGSAEPIAFDRRFVEQIPFMKALTAYYSLDLGSLRRRTEIRKDETTTSEELQALLDPIIAQERIIDVILTRKAMEDHANPFQALVAAGTWGGEKIRERIVQHAAGALRYQLINPDKLAEYINDSRLYLAAKADVLRYSASLTQAYEDAIAEKVDLEMNATQPLLNWTDYFIMGLATLPRNEEERARRRHEINYMRFSAAQDPEPSSTEATQAAQRSITKIVKENLNVTELNESIDGIALSILTTLSYLQRKAPHLLADRTLNKNNQATVGLINQLVLLITHLQSEVRNLTIEPNSEKTPEKQVLEHLQKKQDEIKQRTSFTSSWSKEPRDTIVEFYIPIGDEYYKVEVIGGNRSIRINDVTKVDKEHLRSEHKKRLDMPNTSDRLVGKLVRYENKLFVVTGVASNGELELELIGIPSNIEFERRRKTYLQINPNALLITNITGTEAGISLATNGFAIETRQEKTYVLVDPFALLISTGQLPDIPTRPGDITRTLTVPEQASTLEEQPTILYSMLELMRTIGWSLPALKQTDNETITVAPTDEEIYIFADRGIITLRKSKALEYLDRIIDSLKQQLSAEPNKRMLEIYALRDMENLSTEEAKLKVRNLMINALNRIASLRKQISDLQIPENQEIQFSTTLDIIAQDTEKRLDDKYNELISHLTQAELRNTALSTLFAETQRIREEKGTPTQQLHIYPGPQFSYTGTPKSYANNITLFLTHVIRQALDIPVEAYEIRKYTEALGITYKATPSNIQWYYTRPELRNQPEKLGDIQKDVHTEIESTLRQAGLTEDQIKQTKPHLLESLSATVRSKQPAARTTPDTHLGIQGVSLLGDQSAQPTIEYLVLYAYGKPFAVGIQHASSPQRPRDRTLTSIYLLPDYKKTLSEAKSKATKKSILPTKKTADRLAVEEIPTQKGTPLYDIVNKEIVQVPIGLKTTAYQAYAGIMHTAISKGVVFFPSGSSFSMHETGLLATYESKYLPDIAHAVILSLQTFIDSISSKIHIQSITNNLYALQEQLNVITLQITSGRRVTQETIDNVFMDLARIIGDLASQLEPTVYKDSLDNSIREAIKEFYANLPVAPALQSQALSQEIQTYNEALGASNPEAVTDPAEASDLSDQGEPRRIEQTPLVLAHQLQQKMEYIARDIVSSKIQTIEKIKDITLQEGIESTARERFLPQIEQQVQKDRNEKVIADAIDSIKAALETIGTAISEQAADGSPLSVDPLGFQMLVHLRTEITAQFLTRLTFGNVTETEKDAIRDFIVGQIDTILQNTPEDSGQKQIIKSLKDHYEANYSVDKIDVLGKLLQTWIIAELNLSQDNETRQQVLNHLRFSGASQEGVPKSIASNLTLATVFARAFDDPYYLMVGQTIGGEMRVGTDPEPGYRIKDQTRDYLYTKALGSGHSKKKVLAETNRGITIVPATKEPYLMGQGVLPNITTTTGLLSEHIHKLAIAPKAKIFDNQNIDAIEAERNQVLTQRIIYYETPDYILKGDIADIILFLYLGMPYHLKHEGTITNKTTNKVKNLYLLEEDPSITAEEKARALENALTALHSIFSPPNNNPIHVPPGILGKLPSDPALHPTAKQTELGLFGNIIDYAIGLSTQTQRASHLWTLPQDANRTREQIQIQEIARIIWLFKRETEEEKLEEDYRVIRGEEILKTIKDYQTHLGSANNQQISAREYLTQDMHLLVKSLIAASVYTVFSAAADNMHKYTTAESWGADLERSLLRVLATIDPSMKTHTKAIKQIFEQYESHTPFARNGAYQVFGNINRIITKKHFQENKYETYDEEGNALEQNIQTIPSYATIAEESLENISEPLDPRMNPDPYYYTTRESVDTFDSSEKPYLLDMEKTDLSPATEEDRKEATIRYLHRKGGYLIREKYQDQDVIKVMRGYPAPIVSSEMRLINAFTQTEQSIEFAEKIGQIQLRKGNLNNLEAIKRTALAANGFFMRKTEQTAGNTLRLINTQMRYMFSELFSIPPIVTRNKNIDAIPIIETIENQGTVVGRRLTGSGIIQSELRSIKYTIADLSRLATHLSSILIKKKRQAPEEPNLFELFDDAYGVGVSYTYTPTSLAGRMGAFLYTAGAAITNFKLRGMSFLAQLSRLVISLDVGTFVPILASAGIAGMAALSAYLFAQKIDQYIRARGARIYDPIALTSGFVRTAIRGLRYIGKTIAFSMFTDNMHAILLHKLRKELAQKYRIETRNRTTLDILRDLGTTKGRYFDLTYQETSNAIFELLRNYGLDPANTIHLVAHAAAVARTFGYTSVLPTTLVADSNDPSDDITKFVNAIRPFAEQVIEDLKQSIQLYEKQAPLPFVWVKPRKPGSQDDQIQLGEYQPNEQLLSAITRALSLLAEITYNTGNGKIQQTGNTYNLAHGIPSKLTANYGVATIYMNLLFNYLQDNRLPMTNTNLTQDLITIARAILYDLESKTSSDNQTQFWQALAEAAILRRNQPHQAQTGQQQQQQQNQPQIDPTILDRAYEALHRIREIVDVADVPRYKPTQTIPSDPTQWEGIQYLTKDMNSNDERILSAIPIAFVALKNKNRYKDLDYFRAFTRALALFEATLHNSPYSVNMVRGVMVQTLLLGTQSADLAHKIENAHIQRSYGMHTLMQIMSESSAMLAPTKPTPKATDIPFHTFYALTQIANSLQALNAMVAAVHGKLLPRGSPLGVLANVVNNYGAQLLALTAVGMLKYPQVVGSAAEYITSMPYMGPLLLGSMIFGVGLKAARQLLPPAGNLFLATRKAFSTNQLYPASEPLARSIIQGRQVLYSDIDALKQYTKRREDVNNLADEISNEDQNLIEHTLFTILQALNIYHINTARNNQNALQEMIRTTPETFSQQPRRTIVIKLNKRFIRDFMRDDKLKTLDEATIESNIRDAIIAALKRYYNPIASIPTATVGSAPDSNIIKVAIAIGGNTYEIEIMNLDELQVIYNKGNVEITLPAISPAKLAQQLLAITLHEMGIIQLNQNQQNNAPIPIFIHAINETNRTILDRAAQAIHDAVRAERGNIQGQITTANIINRAKTHFLTVKKAIAELAAYTLSDGQSKAILTNTTASEDVATDDTPIKKLKDGLASDLQNTRMFDLAVEMLLAITKPMAQEIERLFNTDTPVTSNYQQVGDIELQIENEHEFVARRLLEEIASAAGGNPEPLAEAIDQHYSRDAERYYDDSIKIAAARVKQLIEYLERSEQEIANILSTAGGIGNRPYGSLVEKIRSQVAAGNLTQDKLNEIVDFVVGLITARDQMTLQTAAIIDQLRMTNNALGQRMNNLTHEDANGIYIKRILELLTLTDPEREAPSGYTFAKDGTLSQVSARRVAEDIRIANKLASSIKNITSYMIQGMTHVPIDPYTGVGLVNVMVDIKNLMTTFERMEVEARVQQQQMGFDPSTTSLTKHIASAMTQALGHLAEAMIARELMLRNQNTQTDLSGENALQHYANAMLLRAHLEHAAYEINKALLLTDSLAENDREIVLFLRTYNQLTQNNAQIYPIIDFIRQRILHRLAERIPNITNLTQQQINQFVPSFTNRTIADRRIFKDAIKEAQEIAQIRPAQIISQSNTAPTVALDNERNYRSTMAHMAHIMQEVLTISEELPNSFLSIYTMDLVKGYFDKTKTVMDDVKAIRAESPSVEFVKQVMKHKTDLIVSSLDKGTTKDTKTFIEELSDTVSRISSLIILVGVQAAHRARTASQAFNNTLNLYSRAPQFMNILNSLAINIFNKKLFSKRKLIKMPMATLLLTATFVLPTLLGWFVAPAINLYRPNVAAGDYKIMLAPKGGDLVVEMPDYGTKYEVAIAGIPYSLSYDLSNYILQSITTPEGYSEDTAKEIGGTAQDIATRILRGYFGGPTINTNILTRLTNIAISKSTDSAVRTTPSFAYFGSYPYEYPIGTFFTEVMEQIISSPEGMVPRAIYRSYTTQDPRIETLLDLQRTDRLNTLEAVLKGASEGLGIQYRVQYFPYGATNDPPLLELRPAFSNKIIIIREPYTTYAANTINGTPYTPFTATNIGQFAIFQTDTRNVLISRYNDLGWITRSDYRSNPVLSTYNLEIEKYRNDKFRRFQPGRDLAREYTELLYLTRANLFGTRPDVSENPFLMQQLKRQLLEQAFNKPYEQISLEEETMFFAARSVALATASTQVQYYNMEDTDAQTKATRNALLLGHALQTANILYASPVEAEAITQAIEAELNTLLRNTEAYGNILTNPIHQRLLETAEAMGSKILINLDVSRMNTEQINKQVQTELQKLLMTPREPHVAHEHGMIVFRDLTPTQIEGLNTMIRSEYQNDQFDVEIIPFRIRSERIKEQKEARLGTEIQTKETTGISRGVAIIIKHRNEETGQKEVVASYAYFENVLTREKQPVSWALTPITIEKAELLTSTTNYQPIRTLTNKLMENFVRDIFNKSLREYSVPQTVMWWMSQPRNKDSSDAYRLTKTLYAGLDPQSRMWATALETTMKGTEQISTANKIINSKNNITRNIGITITTNNIQRQHTIAMIQEMINDARNQNNSLDTNNKTRNKRYIEFLKQLLQDEKQIAMITNAANAAAQQAMKDLVEIFGVDNTSIRTQVLSTALYGAILTHYAELNGYTSIIGGKEYERDVYPRYYTMLALHLIPKPPQNGELAQEIIKTYGRIEQSFTKLGGRIEPTEGQVNN